MRGSLLLVLFVGLGGVGGCGDPSPAVPMDACGPNRPCPTGYSCDGRQSPAVCVMAPTMVSLDLAISGHGTVLVEGGGTCNQNTCIYMFQPTATVMLTAQPDAGARFVHWSGDCTGTTPTLSLTLADARSCTATFATIDTTLFTVTVTATAGGTVGVTPTIPCGAGGCSGSVQTGTDLSLMAVASTGHRFTGWTGSPTCDGRTDSPLAIELAGDLSCTAHFVQRVTIAGAMPAGLDGAITATAPDASSSCTGSSCVADAGKSVTLVAPTVAGHRLTGWSGTGCDAGTVSGSGLTLVASSDVTCTAIYALGVSVSGTVVGAVGEVIASSGSAHAQCASGSCAIDQGGDVTLTAPDLAPASRFLGWSGDPVCTGTDLAFAVHDVQSSVSCRAGYVARRSVTGLMPDGVAGAVTATSADLAASCAGDACTVDAGGRVTLTAPPVAGHRFLGWDGCSGTTASVTVTATDIDVTCRARFAAEVTVTAAVSGASGDATADSVSSGAVCTGAHCILDSGGSVTLTAPLLEPAFRFVGWQGDTGCTGAARAITLDDVTRSLTCTAVFVGRVHVQVTIADGVSVTGPATIASDDPAASCDATSCAVDAGRSVTIGAPGGDGFRFTGWSPGVCGATASSTFTPSADVTCTADYVQQFTIAATAGGGGTATATANGQACVGASCLVDAGTGVTLEATASPGFHFVSWSGAGCAPATNPQTLTDVNATCMASFAADPTFTASGMTSPTGVVPITASAAAGSCANGSCTSLPSGTAVTFSFQPAAVPRGHHFVDWSPSCRGVAPSPSVTVTVTADLTCTALFRIDVGAVAAPAHASFAVTPASCPGGAAPICTVDPGTTVTFTVTPDAGWTLAGWSGAACATIGNRATVTAPTQPSTCTAQLVPPSWAAVYAEAGGNFVEATGFVALGPSTFALSATSSTGTATARWVLPIAAGDGSPSAPLQFTGVGLPGDGSSNGSLQPIGDLVAVGGDLAWMSLSSDTTTRAPLVVRHSLSQGLRYSVLVPFTPTGGATVSQDIPVALAASGQNLWLGTSPLLDAGGTFQHRAVVSELGPTGALLQHFVFAAPLPISECLAPPPVLPGQVFDVLLGGLADVGDGLVVVLTDSPVDDWMLVEKLSYAGVVDWARAVFLGNPVSVHRVVATAHGGSVVVGHMGSNNAESFYLAFDEDGAAGFSGGTYGHLLYQDGPSSDLAAAAPLPGGGLALAGSTTIMNTPADGIDAWLVVVGPDGAVEAQRAFGGTDTDLALGVAPVAGGSYVLAGTTSSFGGDTDAWALRTDASLNVAFSGASGAHQLDTGATALSVVGDVHPATFCATTPTILTTPATGDATITPAPVSPVVLPLAP